MDHNHEIATITPSVEPVSTMRKDHHHARSSSLVHASAHVPPPKRISTSSSEEEGDEEEDDDDEEHSSQGSDISDEDSVHELDAAVPVHVKAPLKAGATLVQPVPVHEQATAQPDRLSIQSSKTDISESHAENNSTSQRSSVTPSSHLPAQEDQPCPPAQSANDDDIKEHIVDDRLPSPSTELDSLATPTLARPVLPALTIKHQTPSLELRSQPEDDESDRVSVSPPVSPLGPNDLQHLSMDSMTSIALSQSSLDYDHLSTAQIEDVLATPRVHGIGHRRKPSSLDIVQNRWQSSEPSATIFDTAKDELAVQPMSAIEGERDVWARESLDFSSPPRPINVLSSHSSIGMAPASLDDFGGFGDVDSLRRGSDATEGSDGPQVNWQALDQTEEQEKVDKDLPEGAEDESTAFLLARLELENAKFTSDPKSAAVHKAVARARANSVRPSVKQLKRLVSDASMPSIRYSFATDNGLPEETPHMTELEFWAALVQDYPSTASRLPTLTTTKIRAGVPPPLRGVVWTSIAGARDHDLEDAYEKLLGEKSPYEGIINKDVGRSFPGVELFRDADGEGQKMLGRVLKCFSLQDKDIGYCQGLGFLVGPLLMNMGERDAFCVLTRLMDHYSLRPSFLPSLSGLHMRIFQFSSLLKQHNAQLHQHLSELGVEPAYLSQWFLSCFAVTCPLQMLFRIYDVIFAEGANETVMRIALALMRRHEERMLACSEFEEIMQLLLGREIWDCYGGDADLLVDDFTSLGDIVTYARLAELERDFETKSSETVGQSAGFLPDVQAAASRFLGRLWAPGQSATAARPLIHTSKPSLSLSPPPAEREGSGLSIFGRQSGFLRRTPSKNSIPLMSESNGSETSGSSGASLASTVPTEIDTSFANSSGLMRESMVDSMSMKSKAESVMPSTPGFHNREQQELHGQIEDLLTALSEMQREHAQLAAMLQREREDRNDDHGIMRQLMIKLRKETQDDRRRTMPPPARQRIQDEERSKNRPLSVGDRSELPSEPAKPKDEMEDLVDKLQDRLQRTVRFSTNLETKAQLRSTLARTREQLAAAEARSRDLSARLESTESAMNAFQTESDDLRSEVKELRTRVNDDFRARQKLEHQLAELKAQARSVERKERRAKVESLYDVGSLARTETSSDSRSQRKASLSSLPAATAGGLRELKLVRRGSASMVPLARPARVPSPFSPSDTFARSLPAIETSSPALSTASLPPPASPDITSPITPPLASSTLSVPPAGFAQRTSSLVAQEVFATSAHEPVPEDALLLELVNAKTAEAQARQENDELKRALAVSKRRQDEALRQLRAELANAQAEATRAARAEQDAWRQMNGPTPVSSVPPTPFTPDDSFAAATSVHGMTASVSSSTSIASTAEDDKGLPTVSIAPPPSAPTHAAAAAAAAVSSAASGVGGWFWGRRTPSASNVPVVTKE